jgi:hypothetical protein
MHQRDYLFGISSFDFSPGLTVLLPREVINVDSEENSRFAALYGTSFLIFDNIALSSSPDPSTMPFIE